jgi:hypothetical protein
MSLDIVSAAALMTEGENNEPDSAGPSCKKKYCDKGDRQKDRNRHKEHDHEQSDEYRLANQPALAGKYSWSYIRPKDSCVKAPYLYWPV